MAQPEQPDYEQYAYKAPTDLQARFAPWIVEKTGYTPGTAKTKQDAFEAGVRLAVTLRIPFQASPENREATEQRRQETAEERELARQQRAEEKAAKAAEKAELAAAKEAERQQKAAEKAAAKAAAPAEEEAPAKPAKPAKATPAATPAKAAAAPVGRRTGARKATANAASPF